MCTSKPSDSTAALAPGPTACGIGGGRAGAGGSVACGGREHADGRMSEQININVPEKQLRRFMKCRLMHDVRIISM